MSPTKYDDEVERAQAMFYRNEIPVIVPSLMLGLVEIMARSIHKLGGLSPWKALPKRLVLAGVVETSDQ